MRSILLIAAGALTLSACDKAPDAGPASRAAKPLPATIQAADPAIRSVTDHGDQLGVTAFYGTDGEELTILDAGMTAAAIGKAMQAGAADGAKATSVLLTVNAAGVDRLGNKGDLSLMQVTFPADDLRKAKFDNLGPGQALDLASDLSLSSAAGGRALVTYCQSSAKSAGYVSPFCELVAQRLSN